HVSFLFHRSPPPPHLSPFPTRRSSDLHSLAVDIAKPYDFHDVAIAFHDLLPPSKGAASTGTYEGHPQPSLGGPRSANNRTSRKGQGCAARNERASRDC